MKKIMKPCGLHCIKIKHMGVTMGEQIILNDVNLHIHCGSLTAVIGKNGAGKSTLIRAILGDIPHTGNIEFKDLEDGNLHKLRIGYVPQTLNVEKNTPVSVYDLLAGFYYKAPVFVCKTKKMEAEIREYLRVFGVEDLIHKQVCNLSGGQLQRVLLSLAIMNDPHLLLLDEPVSGIDNNGMETFYETIDYLKTHYDLAIILISHDLDYVARFADQVVLLDKTVLTQGSVGEVYKSDAFKQTFQSVSEDQFVMGGKTCEDDTRPGNEESAMETMNAGKKAIAGGSENIAGTGAFTGSKGKHGVGGKGGTKGNGPAGDEDFVYVKRSDVKPAYPRQQHTCDHHDHGEEEES